MRTSMQPAPAAGAFSAKPRQHASTQVLRPEPRAVRGTDAALARNDAAFDRAAELDAWSRHAMAANGFGSAALAGAARVARREGTAALADQLQRTLHELHLYGR